MINFLSNTRVANRSAAFLSRGLPVAFLMLGMHPVTAAEPADPSVKLREQLRSVMLQLRTAQTDAANAQAAKAIAEAKSIELTAKIKSLEENNAKIVKQSNSDKAALQASITALEAKLADREKRIQLLNETLEKWKAGYEKAAGMARTTEEERVKLAAEIVVNKRTIADRERKNISLFNTSNEILDRYENYAIGKALAAKEPFIGTTRVKIENQVQGYKDKILDNRLGDKSKKP